MTNGSLIKVESIASEHSAMLKTCIKLYLVLKTLFFCFFESGRFTQALHEFCNRWCKREHVESYALNSWKLNILKIIDGRISFYCNNLELLPAKPKFTFRHLKKVIQEFHRRFVLAPADKAANNVVVV